VFFSLWIMDTPVYHTQPGLISLLYRPNENLSEETWISNNMILLAFMMWCFHKNRDNCVTQWVTICLLPNWQLVFHCRLKYKIIPYTHCLVCLYVSDWLILLCIKVWLFIANQYFFVLVIFMWTCLCHLLIVFPLKFHDCKAWNWRFFSCKLLIELLWKYLFTWVQDYFLFSLTNPRYE
jgi:hypothetical protein